jgi:hypothetical protein
MKAWSQIKCRRSIADVFERWHERLSFIGRYHPPEWRKRPSTY